MTYQTKVCKTIIPGGSAAGTMSVPGDKSISIRAILLSSIADGKSTIRGLGAGEDVQSALGCIRQLGIKVKKLSSNIISIFGNGLYGFSCTDEPLNCGNSATTLRLLSGILAGQKKTFYLTGDESLRRRPMKRILDPLRKMGAVVRCTETDDAVPYSIHPAVLKPLNYDLPVASAQVKSSILLAGLYAQGETTVREPMQSRDHTELMLSACGVDLSVKKELLEITVNGVEKISALDLTVPGDISGAAFFILLATLLPGSRLLIENVGVNSTRAGVIDTLRSMGADIKLLNERTMDNEKLADIKVRSARLVGTVVEGDQIPAMIDELPIVAVAAAFAEGTTIIRDAKELRVKETDRIKALSVNLEKMGAHVEELPDGIIIHGGHALHNAEFESFGDHRIAMAFAVASTAIEGRSTMKDSEWADVSFPGFFDHLDKVRGISFN